MPVGVTELATQRRLTAEFIRRGNRKRLLLNRETLVQDLSGGWRQGTPTALAGQEFHLGLPTTQLPERNTAAGQTVQPEYVLVGYHNADIHRGDWFFLDGIKYEIVFIHPDRSYETRAEVVYLG